MNKKFKLFLSTLFIVSLLQLPAYSQKQDKPFDPERFRELRFMFYNVENAFDTIDDPNTNDEEFLPDGVRHWNAYKYYKKINNIYKVIAAAGGWNPPDLVGLC